MGYSSGAAAARVAGSLSVAAAGAGSSLAVVAVVAVADFSSAVVAVAVAGSSSAVAAVVVDYKIIKSRYAAITTTHIIHETCNWCPKPFSNC